MDKKPVIIALLILVLVGAGYLWQKNRQTSKGEKPSVASDKTSLSSQSSSRATSATSKASEKKINANSDKVLPSASTALAKLKRKRFSNLDQLLDAYGASKDWVFHRGENGSLFKLTGESIPGLINHPEALSQFNQSFLKVQGITRPSYVEVSARQDGIVTHQDYEQKVRGPSGGSFPVWEGWIRYLGNGNTGDVFQITNQLKKVDPRINLNLTLTVPEAIEIAHRYLKDAKIRCDTDGAALVYTEGNPQELIYIVNAHAGAQSRRLFIGNDTRQVVLDFPAAIF